MDKGNIVKSDDLGYKYSLRNSEENFPFDVSILANETINVNPNEWDYLKHKDFLKCKKSLCFYVLDKFVEGEYHDYNHKLPKPRNLPEVPAEK